MKKWNKKIKHAFVGVEFQNTQNQIFLKNFVIQKLKLLLKQ